MVLRTIILIVNRTVKSLLFYTVVLLISIEFIVEVYLIGEDIYDDIGEVDDLLLVGAERGAAQAGGAHVQGTHPAPADHRAMHSQAPTRNSLLQKH